MIQKQSLMQAAVRFLKIQKSLLRDRVLDCFLRQNLQAGLLRAGILMKNLREKS